tara:strand:- start:247 stop:453 length:207 start_codon:yes stop_codon:yes gene_type:complete
MKLVLNLSLTALTLLSFYDKTFALTNYQINKICKKEKRVSNCVKNLKVKKDNLQKGNLIEIPVIPYKR